MNASPPRRHRLRRLARGLGAVAVLALPAHAAAAGSDTVLVRVDPDSTRAERARVGALLDAEAVTSLPGGWREYRVPEPVTTAQARRDLRGAEAAADVRLPQRLRPLVYDDPLLTGGQQWGLRNLGTPGADIRADGGWPRATTAAPVVVAVVDTGVQTSHPDLSGRIWTNADEIPGNGVDDDGNGYVDDTAGWDFVSDDGTVYDDPSADTHGTHVAGIIAARQGNGSGIAGVAGNARIMPLKFIGSGGTGFNSDAIRAIQYAVDNGATVINGSFGGGSNDPALCAAISWAAQRGVVFVAAAGNSGQDLGVVGTWPARCAEPSMITVSSVTSSGGLSSFSNHSAVHADLGAPGSGVVSTVPGGYQSLSGTSMAAPHVAGVVAAVRGEHPGATPGGLRALVMDTARPLPSLTGKTVSGGMVDMDSALAGSPGAGPDTTAPGAFDAASPAPEALVASRRPTFTWTAAQDDTGVTGYRVLVDGAEVARTAGGTSAVPAVDLAEGRHTWSVEASDAAGNVRSTAPRSVSVDTTPPAAPVLTSPAAGASVARVVALAWLPGSDTSGLARHEVLLDGTPLTSAPPGAAGLTVMLPTGTHTLAVRAVDAAGNRTDSASRTVTVRTTVTAPAPRVRVAPRPVRVGRRLAVRVRASYTARVTLVAVSAKGRRVGSMTRVVPRGASLVPLPSALASQVRRGGRIGLGTVAAARR